MDDETSEMPEREGWVARFGHRNISYIVFVIILIPLAYLLEAGGPSGSDAGGGLMAGIMLWGVVTLAFFVGNLGLLIWALAKGQPALKPFIACLLPVLLIVGTLLAEEIMLRK